MKHAWMRMAVLSAAVGGLGACRPSIAPVEAEARTRVPASPAPGLELCWVESANKAGFTASSVVVRHPDGTLVVDGGNSNHFREEIAVYGAKDRRWFKLLPGNLRPRMPLGMQLDEVGVDPASLRWLLPTHAHLDHIGGFLDVPPTPVLLSGPEIDLIERARTEVLFEVIPAHAEAIAPLAEELVFTRGAYEIFDRHADLFGDGSVVVVPMYGHTPGSVGVFFNLPSGRRIFHVGDAVNNRRQISKLRGRSLGLRRTDSDRSRADTIVGQLHELAAQSPELEILPAHERRAWKEVFGEPDGQCEPPARTMLTPA